jgi:Flp pilus assembly secretin CpaC
MRTNMTSVHTTAIRRLRRATKSRPASVAALVVAIIVILVATPQAQQQAPAFAAAASTGGPAPMATTPTDVDLLVGRSIVLNVGSPIARVSLTVPDVADAMVTAPGQLLIHGKQPGTISLFVWDRGGAITTYEVKVRRDPRPSSVTSSSSSPANRSRFAAAARTSCSRARSPAST